MSSRLEINKMKSAIIESGRAAMHAMKPDEFEYYACTFELLDSDYNVEEIFHFPVTPSQMSINGQTLANIKKLSQGYLVQFNDSFAGKNISISGSFGRRFRLMLNDGELKLRTGYGATKMLEKIMMSNHQLDSKQKPRFLVFHNYAFNHSGIVEILNYSFQQSMENNMMWNYTIEMKMVADATKVLTSTERKGDLIRLLSESVMSKNINDILSNVTLQGAFRKVDENFI